MAKHHITKHSESKVGQDGARHSKAKALLFCTMRCESGEVLNEAKQNVTTQSKSLAGQNIEAYGTVRHSKSEALSSGTPFSKGKPRQSYVMRSTAMQCKGIAWLSNTGQYKAMAKPRNVPQGKGKVKCGRASQCKGVAAQCEGEVACGFLSHSPAKSKTRLSCALRKQRNVQRGQTKQGHSTTVSNATKQRHGETWPSKAMRCEAKASRLVVPLSEAKAKQRQSRASQCPAKAKQKRSITYLCVAQQRQRI